MTERWEYGTLYTVYPNRTDQDEGLSPRCLFATANDSRVFDSYSHQVWDLLGAEGWILGAEPAVVKFVPEWLAQQVYGRALKVDYGTADRAPSWAKQHARRRVS